MGAKILTAEISSVFLPEEGALRRLPRAPHRKRPKKFYVGFEDRALVYDVFWHMDASQVLMVCPPAQNLADHWAAATFKALPSGQNLSASFHSIRSTMTIALKDVPDDTKKIEINFAGQIFVADIMPNLTREFDGTRLIFTMSQNNPLDWINQWARFHQTMHEADAVIIFDNGSSIYSPEDVAKNLAQIRGIKRVLVVPVPHKYGPHDSGVLFNRFWANFLQVSTFSILLRRFGNTAFGLLNVDIDELGAPVPASNLFEVAHESVDGFCSLAGNWVESIVEPDVNIPTPDHTAYRHVLRVFRHGLNANKWVFEPTRNWVQNLDIHPSPHRIKNMPKYMAKRAPKGLFWHFRGINNNWKEQRSSAKKINNLLQHEHPDLRVMFEKYLQKRDHK
jgi:hypothetical protein